MPAQNPLQHLLEANLRTLVAEEVTRALAASVPEPIEPWLDVKQAKDHLGVTEDALRAMVKRGQLLARRTPTGRIVFRASELDAWVLSGGLDV